MPTGIPNPEDRSNTEICANDLKETIDLYLKENGIPLDTIIWALILLTSDYINEFRNSE